MAEGGREENHLHQDEGFSGSDEYSSSGDEVIDHVSRRKYSTKDKDRWGGGDVGRGRAEDTAELGSNEDDDEEDDDDLDLDDEGDGDYDTDVEDNEEEEAPVLRQRKPVTNLPETVTTLDTEDGGKVYVIGTAHFSEESQQDVIKTIESVQPDVVLVELCKSRVNILQLDEKTLLEEAKNINIGKVKLAIKQSGLVTGLMQILLLHMSAHITEQLGMAPGGEFRTAFRQAQQVPSCKVHLGDRPIQITLQRAIAALSVWQKLRLAWYMIMSKEPISKEEVEKCKQRDLLEEMLAEMTGEFPALSRVFVTERDQYLAHSLRLAARPVPTHDAQGVVPAVVVGVVGMGHVPGIVEKLGQDCGHPEVTQCAPNFSNTGDAEVDSKARAAGTFRLRLLEVCQVVKSHEIGITLEFCIGLP
ncbi:traB domain-containing protein-like isoform X2 [Branchiostoma floridae]|uniref:TraB domain-containing protein-like isoform X2 n=1 Tax=Branchiostoma floridae TaxID=7739 RepID=A0A9J7L748_BRAFL|nr:traB domain-containing protein-like isoform X2 [Branchiostoma floridae]